MKNKNKRHRYSIYMKQNFTCNICLLKFEVPEDWNELDALHNGEMFLEIDHIKPVSKGGSDEIENKQALCGKCNNKKSAYYEAD